MQKQTQAKPGSTGTSEDLKGSASAQRAALKGQNALNDIDALLAQQVEPEQEEERYTSRCGCGW